MTRIAMQGGGDHALQRGALPVRRVQAGGQTAAATGPRHVCARIMVGGECAALAGEVDAWIRGLY